jgi:pimeloyl-ACP methyl ester carboxylesterase
LVYVHGWLEPGSWIEEALVFPGWVRNIDIDVVHVSLPFHGRRNPRGALFSGEYFWTADLVRSVEAVRQAIHDARSMAGWLRRQGYEQVGVAGISVGGSLAMMLACLEPLPDYVVAIVAHLRLHEAVEHASILWRVKRDLERWGVGYLERREAFRRLGLDTFRPKLLPNRQLWIAARQDAHIDPNLVVEQWLAWNKPNLHWIPGGHMTFPLHLPEITRKMKELIEG